CYQLALHLLEGDGVPQNLVMAETHLRQAARMGYAGAMLALARMHGGGRAAAPSQVEAALWYRAAADAGEAEAQFSLGALFARGEGVPKRLGDAARWCQRAAEQGHLAAQVNIAAFYQNGTGVVRDPAHAAAGDAAMAERLLRRAADRGSAPALLHLGHYYAQDRGAGMNQPEAIRWYRAAAEAGVIAAQWIVGSNTLIGAWGPRDAAAAAAWFR